MDYSNIPDIYGGNIPNNKQIELDVKSLDTTITINPRTTSYKKKPNLIIIKTTLNFINGMLEYTPIINNLIYFPFSKSTVYQYSIQSHNYDLHNPYLDLYQLTVKNRRYNIYNANSLLDYCSGDEYLTLFNFKKKYVYKKYIFNIYIHLVDPNTIKKIIIKKDLSTIKIPFRNFIFHFKVEHIDKQYVELQLYGISDTITDKTLNIDVKFNDINTIYSKYEKAIDDVNEFLNMPIIYEIEMRLLESKINGTYYPNGIYYKKIE